MDLNPSDAFAVLMIFLYAISLIGWLVYGAFQALSTKPQKHHFAVFLFGFVLAVAAFLICFFTVLPLGTHVSEYFSPRIPEDELTETHPDINILAELFVCGFYITCFSASLYASLRFPFKHVTHNSQSTVA